MEQLLVRLEVLRCPVAIRNLITDEVVIGFLADVERLLGWNTPASTEVDPLFHSLASLLILVGQLEAVVVSHGRVRHCPHLEHRVALLVFLHFAFVLAFLNKYRLFELF